MRHIYAVSSHSMLEHLVFPLHDVYPIWQTLLAICRALVVCPFRPTVSQRRSWVAFTAPSSFETSGSVAVRRGNAKLCRIRGQQLDVSGQVCSSRMYMLNSCAPFTVICDVSSQHAVTTTGRLSSDVCSLDEYIKVCASVLRWNRGAVTLPQYIHVYRVLATYTMLLHR